MSWRRVGDNLIVALAVIAILLVFVGLPIYVTVAAPCKYLDWMSVKNVPARCLK